MSRRCLQGQCSSALQACAVHAPSGSVLVSKRYPQGKCFSGLQKLARCARRFACACAKADLLWQQLNASKPKPDQCLAARGAAYIVHCCGQILARCRSWRSAEACPANPVVMFWLMPLPSTGFACFTLSRRARQAFQTLCRDAARRANVLARSKLAPCTRQAGQSWCRNATRMANVLADFRSLRAARDGSLAHAPKLLSNVYRRQARPTLRIAPGRFSPAAEAGALPGPTRQTLLLSSGSCLCKEALSRASRFRAARDKRFRLDVETLPAGPMF